MTTQKAIAYLNDHPKKATVSWALPDGKFKTVYRTNSGFGVYIGK